LQQKHVTEKEQKDLQHQLKKLIKIREEQLFNKNLGTWKKIFSKIQIKWRKLMTMMLLKLGKGNQEEERIRKELIRGLKNNQI
jgi:hypothetical protein